MDHQCAIQKFFSETLAPHICTHHHSAQAVGNSVVLVGNTVVMDETKVGLHTPFITAPEVERRLFAVVMIEFFFVNVLFKKEHFGAQHRHFENIVRCEFTKRFRHNVAGSHALHFNGATPQQLDKGFTMVEKVTKDDALWKQELPPERYAILRQSATEPPWSGELLGEKRDGVYSCAGCGQALFASGTKFESDSGWPSFWDAIEPGAVELHEDRSLFSVRTEVVCAACGGHLGHVFPDAYGTPTGQRYCMNSLAMEFGEASV
jgi:peptide-methionine (R)-S-oxide reductase